ncbi:MAG TPA: flagellar filament capping protein FliD, partial [Myxococcota bacterium]|nr:flagellar filament capping protein FliD [Myxococcota bacterium]
VSKGSKFTANESNPFAYSVGESEGGTIGGIGLVLSNDGRLRVDKEKLSDALARDPLSVREFLRGAALDPNVDDPENQAIIEANPNDPPEPDWFQDGFATLVASTLEGIVRSADGTLARRDEAYQKRLDSFDDSIDRFEQRLAKREESLILRFSELERIVSSLQTQQGFLSGLG